MNRNLKKNQQISALAIILVAVNLGVWIAAQEGALSPARNDVQWGVSMVLNTVAIVWVVALLGVQPFIVLLSFVAGGFLSIKAVQGMGGNISTAEIAASGAAYGGFGAIAVCGAATKVRLALLKKRQFPFVFIIVALLAFDAVFQIVVSDADRNMVLRAMVLPLVLSGGAIGLAWSMFHRFVIGRNPDVTAARATNRQAAAADKPIMQNLDLAKVDEEPVQIAAVAEKTVKPTAPPAPSPKTAVAPVMARKDEEVEALVPFETERNDNFEPPQETFGLSAKIAEVDCDSDGPEPFSCTGSDAELYAGGAMDQGSVMVMEPPVSTALDLDEEPAKVVEKEAPDSEPKSREKKSDDWLSSHLELLNKLK